MQFAFLGGEREREMVRVAFARYCRTGFKRCRLVRSFGSAVADECDLCDRPEFEIEKRRGSASECRRALRSEYLTYRSLDRVPPSTGGRKRVSDCERGILKRRRSRCRCCHCRRSRRRWLRRRHRIPSLPLLVARSSFSLFFVFFIRTIRPCGGPGWKRR